MECFGFGMETKPLVIKGVEDSAVTDMHQVLYRQHRRRENVLGGCSAAAGLLSDQATLHAWELNVCDYIPHS